jgi:DNA-binding HxlR family transcriptional regulator
MEKQKPSTPKKKLGPIAFQSLDGHQTSTPEIDRLVEEIIGRIADKWTMLVLEALAQHGTVRFSRLAEIVEGISQKMLTQTLRAMEADGFITRRVYPVVPPRVEYALAPLGISLGAAFCGVWQWAEKNHTELTRQRALYRKRLSSQE